MSWQNILKSSEDLMQEFEILFRGFPVEREMTPKEERRLRFVVKYLGDSINPYIRSMKYMEDFPEIKRDGLNFVMSFEVYDQTVTLKKSLFEIPGNRLIGNRGGIGVKAGDTFPVLVKTGTRICIKSSGVMTNGDMMVAILLASKNDQLPAILTLPAYVERFFPQVKLPYFNDKGTIFNDMEFDYKVELIRKILQVVEGLPDEEIPDWKVSDKYGTAIISLNRALTEYVPNKVLGRW